MRLTSLDQITQQYRHIYLQPHFDDAALSCGGAIRQQTQFGQRTLVITVFGGLPPESLQPSAFARQNSQIMSLPESPTAAVEARRAEDEAAISSLGADVLWLDYLDAIYRGAPAYYQSNEALFGPVNPGDLPLDEQLGTLFLNLAERAPLAAFYAPLGVGHHVDHQLVCSAADRLAQRKINVKFFEDFPYVSRPGALEARQNELSIPMEFELTEISGQVRDKEEAVALYKSQVPQLFSTEDNMRQALRAYSGSLRKANPGIFIERYWRW
ncbi:MAG TPA: PIG-L family deacetylase [Ktedonobacterales bacterium]|nr:PIG-L family deacetylase [Ktedonobacterales bacterium]HEX5572221.1 PIG-L family deacetylase [Ktedonobacterales bacterium]